MYLCCLPSCITKFSIYNLKDELWCVYHCTSCQIMTYISSRSNQITAQRHLYNGVHYKYIAHTNHLNIKWETHKAVDVFHPNLDLSLTQIATLTIYCRFILRISNLTRHKVLAKDKRQQILQWSKKITRVCINFKTQANSR